MLRFSKNNSKTKEDRLAHLPHISKVKCKETVLHLESGRTMGQNPLGKLFGFHGPFSSLKWGYKLKSYTHIEKTECNKICQVLTI